MEGCRGIVLGQNLCELCQLEEKQICHGNILRCAAFFCLFVCGSQASFLFLWSNFLWTLSVCRTVGRLVGRSVCHNFLARRVANASIGGHFFKYVCVVVGYVCQFVNCLQT